jgi:hypothetical protein
MLIKPKKLNRQSGEIIPNGRPRLKIAMTNIEKPIEIGLQRVGNRWGGLSMKQRWSPSTFIAADFLMSFYSILFFTLVFFLSFVVFWIDGEIVKN